MTNLTTSDRTTTTRTTTLLLTALLALAALLAVATPASAHTWSDRYWLNDPSPSTYSVHASTSVSASDRVDFLRTDVWVSNCVGCAPVTSRLSAVCGPASDTCTSATTSKLYFPQGRKVLNRLHCGYDKVGDTWHKHPSNIAICGDEKAGDIGWHYTSWLN